MQHNVESNGAPCVRSESCGCIEQRAVAAPPILRPAKELLCVCGEPQVQLIQTATGGLFRRVRLQALGDFRLQLVPLPQLIQHLAYSGWTVSQSPSAGVPL